MKNPEEPEASSVYYLYGETLKQKVHIIGCVACRHSATPAKNGYPGIPDWKKEHTELSSLVPNGKKGLKLLRTNNYITSGLRKITSQEYQFCT